MAADAGARAPMERRGGGRLPLLCLLLLATLAVATGIRAVDFGTHWDESKLVDSARATAESGVFLPHWYNYPSFPYLLTLAPAAPELAVALWRGGGDPETAAAIAGDWYRLKVRILFLAVAMLAAPWAFLLARAAGIGGWGALAAGAILLGSWELAYHARWIAPDAVMAQFSVLAAALAAASLGMRRGAAAARLGAAAAAGLALGTKYPGGLSLLPVAVAAVIAWVRRPGRRTAAGLLGGLLAVAAVAAAAFLLSTPGAVLEPGKFRADVAWEMEHYRMGHGGYTVGRGVPHVLLILEYLSLEILSPWAPVALVLFLFACLGLWRLFRGDRGVAAVALSFPFAYAGYFATQNVMIVRNLLPVIPFLAVSAAAGVVQLRSLLPGARARRGVVLIVAALVAANVVWIDRAAESVRHRHAVDHRENVVAYLAVHPDETFYLTPAVRALGAPEDFSLPTVTQDAGRAGRVLLVSTELGVREWGSWPQNRRGRYEVVSGIREVNWDYYASWMGDPHVIAVPTRLARELGVLPEETSDGKGD